MPRPREELTAGEWAVLALLCEEPAHGFALARAMAADGEVGRVWSVRRPLVYRALETLERFEFARPAGTLPSESGPQRTIYEPTERGRAAVGGWLCRPVEHVRDARSLLLLKILFLTRSDKPLVPLLSAQRAQLTGQLDKLTVAAAGASGFERALILWRLENTTAAIRFTDTLLAEGVEQR